MLDYKCYPVWLYDENGNIVDTLLPDELRSDKKLDQLFDKIQTEYDSLFIDNEHEFSYVGFKSEKQKSDFLKEWKNAVNELKCKLKGRYEIIDDIDKSINS